MKSKKHYVLSVDPRKVHSKWYGNILTDWKPDRDYIDYLKRCLKQEKYIPPVIIVQEKELYYIVNGHHRLYAHLEMGVPSMKCILIEGTFQESEPLRSAEKLLKKFDAGTDYCYRFSGYLDRWAAAQEERGFINQYRPTAAYRLLRWIKAWFSRRKPQSKNQE